MTIRELSRRRVLQEGAALAALALFRERTSARTVAYQREQVPSRTG